MAVPVALDLIPCGVKAALCVLGRVPIFVVAFRSLLVWIVDVIVKLFVVFAELVAL